jgi:hypothetical protein
LALAEHLTGRIETFDISEIFQLLEVKRASGRLTLRRGSDVKTIDWKDGDIIYVSGVRPADRLGHALLRSREIPIEKLYAVFARHFATREKLTRLVLDEGLISRDSLATIVEELATRILKEVLSWHRGRFEYNATYQTEDVLQIHLQIKSQVVTFQAARDFDDSSREHGSPSTGEGEGEEWERPFRPDEVESAFWEARARSGGESMDPDVGRSSFAEFRHLAENIRARLARAQRFLPIYDDTARFVEDLLALGASPEDNAEKLVGVVALDPFFAIDLLHLANSLSLRESDAITTPAQAVRRIGPEAFETLARCLSETGEKLPAAGSLPRALRRASLSAAIAAQHLARGAREDPESAYAAGLLHAVPYIDILQAIAGLSFPSGPLRGASIEIFRPVVGRIRAHAMGLPRELAEVLGDLASSDSPPPLVATVRRARRAFPDCAVGALPPESGKRRGYPDAATRQAVARVFTFLDLRPPEGK